MQTTIASQLELVTCNLLTILEDTRTPYHQPPTVFDVLMLVNYCIHQWPVDQHACAANNTILLIQRPGSLVAWHSQVLALLVSTQYLVTKEQGSPQDHSSPVQYPNYSSVQDLIASILV